MIYFASVLADPANPDKIRADYASDRTHPTMAGALAMGNSIDLSAFDAPVRPGTDR
ncbi:hypothetical protein ABN034_33260 [Actinopolymorpha sp. B11F2]|uniref:hypothetical protein n=1 Tax=Actinopolymorpha sp. B11F2 TaxID=3160862 RepID=UPI0032E4963F